MGSNLGKDKTAASSYDYVCQDIDVVSGTSYYTTTASENNLIIINNIVYRTKQDYAIYFVLKKSEVSKIHDSQTGYDKKYQNQNIMFKSDMSYYTSTLNDIISDRILETEKNNLPLLNTNGTFNIILEENPILKFTLYEGFSYFISNVSNITNLEYLGIFGESSASLTRNLNGKTFVNIESGLHNLKANVDKEYAKYTFTNAEKESIRGISKEVGICYLDTSGSKFYYNNSSNITKIIINEIEHEITITDVEDTTYHCFDRVSAVEISGDITKIELKDGSGNIVNMLKYYGAEDVNAVIDNDGNDMESGEENLRYILNPDILNPDIIEGTDTNILSLLMENFPHRISEIISDPTLEISSVVSIRCEDVNGNGIEIPPLGVSGEYLIVNYEDGVDFGMNFKLILNIDGTEYRPSTNDEGSEYLIALI